jgi:hypothetical protein|tara:strand:+ start:653 stop:835 length:183 start_codon:yes stop_codon:yes gene_type:complete
MLWGGKVGVGTIGKKQENGNLWQKGKKATTVKISAHFDEALLHARRGVVGWQTRERRRRE